MLSICLKQLRISKLTLESFFGFRVFANVDRLLVLRVLHISKDVLVCFPLEQVVAYLLMTIIGSIVKWCPQSEVLSIDVGLIGKQ